MKIRPRKQPDSEACGPTSIKIIADYFYVPVSFSDITKISNYKKSEGMTNNDLVKVLKKLDFSVMTMSNVSWKVLASLNIKNNVIVVSWMLKGYIGHFSIVDKVTKTHIFLVDPLVGKVIKMQKILFMRLWFDYDDMWFPEKNTDIQLRWMVVVSKKPLPKNR